MTFNRKLISLALGLSTAMMFSNSSFAADEIYIPLVSKGFQHQFWQAVKLGADQAGKDLKVKVTFEGPETEAMVDKQIDMLSSALAKKPSALGFAALDSKAAIPLLKKAQAAKIPVVAFDSEVDSDIPVTTATTDNKAAAAMAAAGFAAVGGLPRHAVGWSGLSGGQGLRVAHLGLPLRDADGRLLLPHRRRLSRGAVLQHRRLLPGPVWLREQPGLSRHVDVLRHLEWAVSAARALRVGSAVSAR